MSERLVRLETTQKTMARNIYELNSTAQEIHRLIAEGSGMKRVLALLAAFAGAVGGVITGHYWK